MIRETFTPAQVAAMLDCTPENVCIAANKPGSALEAVRTPNGRLLVLADSVERWRQRGDQVDAPDGVPAWLARARADGWPV